MQDETLYKQLQDDREEALGILFDKYFPGLCFYSQRITGSKELAEEIVADVFIRIWENRKKTSIGNVRSYLYTGVKNRSLQIVEKEKTHRSAKREQNDLYLQTTDHESRTISRESLEQVMAVIQKMPEQRRTVFLLNRINGLKYKEIAASLDISIHTVQNHMVNAVRFLHENLSRNYSSK
ncbi:RNA polymerase sigma-70 factor [Sinomicrobium kalidii]|uniref:RNA polymerase sigma-70 factor n=1 Tax=Sinomicrobium kalidii TaxID=2900738 RepID=UPI001E3DAA47|nr:RNA polymerase sigma-70 factor [Sinomicrobium kalidii]UGU15905.1 RNA polymerase sigma-70 factor [Sinomicrobium kalidii]